MSGPAGQAAGALQSLQAEMDAATASLKQLQAAQRNLKSATEPNKAAIKELSQRIAEQKNRLAGAQESALKLGGGLKRIPSATQQAAERTRQLGQQLNDMRAVAGAVPGPVGSMAQSLLGLGSAASGAMVIAGATALIVGVAAAAIAGAAAITHFGIVNANAARDERLHLEALSKLRTWWGAARGNADQMSAAINRISASSALSRSEIISYNDQLYRMGLRGRNLSEALEAVTIKASTQGSEAASQFMALAAGIGFTGGSVSKLAARVKADLGDIARRQALGLTNQFKKLQENVSRLFSGVKIEGLLEGLHEVLQVFNDQTASGAALKALLESAFNPLLGGAKSAGPVMKRFMQGVIIGALEVGIAFQKTRIAIQSAFAATGANKLIAELGGVTIAGHMAVGAGRAMGSAFLPLTTVVPVLTMIRLGLYGILGAINAVAPAIEQVDFITGFSKQAGMMRQAGGMIVQGLADGIAGAVGKVRGAVASLANIIKGDFSSLLQIRSPSRFMASQGVHIGGGTALGIRQSVPQVRAAARTLAMVPMVETRRVLRIQQATPPQEAAPLALGPMLQGRLGMGTGLGGGAPVAAPATAAPAGTRTVIETINVTFQSGDGGKQQARDFLDELSRALEVRRIVMGGLAPEVAT